MPWWREVVQCIDQWYLGSICSTRMTGRKDWFIIISHATNNKVKFVDVTTLAAEGINDVSIKRKDNKHSLINHELYITGIKCNLLSIGQFLEKGYTIHMENKALCVIDANKVLVIKAHMDLNRTFKIELKVIKHRCLTIATSKEEWI